MKNNLFIPTSGTMCFCLHSQGLAAQRVGDLAHIPEVTREMGTSHSLTEHKSSGISCAGARVLLFC